MVLDCVMNTLKFLSESFWLAIYVYGMYQYKAFSIICCTHSNVMPMKLSHPYNRCFYAETIRGSRVGRKMNILYYNTYIYVQPEFYFLPSELLYFFWELGQQFLPWQKKSSLIFFSRIRVNIKEFLFKVESQQGVESGKFIL